MKSTSEICPQCQVLSYQGGGARNGIGACPPAVGCCQEEFRDVVEAALFGHRQAEAAENSRRPKAFHWRPARPRQACTRTLPARASHCFLSLMNSMPVPAAAACCGSTQRSSRRPTGRYRRDAIDHRTAHVPRVLVRRCQKPCWSPLPLRIERGGLVGPHLTVLIAFMKGGCHASYSTIRTFIRDCVGVTLARSTLANTINKVSAVLDGPYDELLRMLPDETVLNIDETGHKCNKELWWTWCLR